jgi:hypothetical protein
VSKINITRKTCLVIASVALCSILGASLFSITMNHNALAQDLSSIKDKASSILNSQSEGNNTGSSSNNNTSSTGDTGMSSLKDKASNTIGNLIK